MVETCFICGGAVGEDNDDTVFSFHRHDPTTGLLRELTEAERETPVSEMGSPSDFRFVLAHLQCMFCTAVDVGEPAA
jgi:hypothetical protein